MALDNLDQILGRGLGTGFGNGIQQLAQANLDRMLGKSNYFQQNLSNILRDLGVGDQQPVQQVQQPPIQQSQQVQQLVQQSQPKKEKPLTAPQKLKREELDIKIAKDARDWINSYRVKAQEADTLRSNFKLMGEAGRSKDIYTGLSQRLANQLGFNAFTTNNASQIFDKLANEVRVHLAKVALPKGSRITNLVEQLVGKTIASRDMDKPAMIALSDAGEKLMELAELEYAEADRKVNEWGGKIPYDADTQVDKSLEKRKKEIRKEAERILHRGIKGEISEKPSGMAYEDVSKIPELKPNQRAWSTNLGRYLTIEELRNMGYAY